MNNNTAIKTNTKITLVQNNTNKTAVREKKYMPLKLKLVLTNHGIRQADWQNAIKQDSSEKPLSPSAGTSILNWNVWPKRTTEESIKSQTVHFLEQHGLNQREILTIWDEDKKDDARNKMPDGLHLNKNYNTSPFEGELPEVEMLSPKTKSHFQLNQDPFINDIKGSNDVFLDADQKYIYEAMYQTARNSGFLAVVGESGAGKSTLRRALLDRIQNENLSVSIIQPRVFDKAKLSTGMICESIIKDITGNEQAKMRATLEGKARQVEKLLTSSSRAGNQHVLLIEEAHDLSIKTLKYLKRFWELEDGFNKLLSIILIGQPELRNLLDERQHWEAREVIARIEIAILQPLNGNLQDYLSLKFKRVHKDISDIFEPDAYDAIRERLTMKRRTSAKMESMMFPLRVNGTITKAMNLAAEIGAPKVNAEIIKEV